MPIQETNGRKFRWQRRGGATTTDKFGQIVQPDIDPIDIWGYMQEVRSRQADTGGLVDVNTSQVMVFVEEDVEGADELTLLDVDPNEVYKVGNIQRYTHRRGRMLTLERTHA